MERERVWPYYASKPLRGGAAKGAGAWIAHAKAAKDGKEDWLLEIGERIAHVPHSWDALTRGCLIFDYESLGLGIVPTTRAGLPTAIE